MKRSFSIKRFVWTCVAIMGIFMLIFVINAIRVGMPSDYYIFADIYECDNLLQTEDDKTVITRLSPEQDKKLKDNKYVEFRGAEYSSPELHFKIFAYEFADADGAKQYFRNVTGKDITFDNTFSLSCGGLRGSLTLIVIDGSNAYRIRSTAKDYKELDALLKEFFNVNIMEKHESEQDWSLGQEDM